MVRDISPVCSVCGKPLSDLITYVPHVGECCHDCYRKASDTKASSKKKVRKNKKTLSTRSVRT